jgi:hypothetical protein
MSTDQKQFKDEKETRANLPDIDSNSPPHEPVKGVPGDLSSDDEFIELVDVVITGEKPQDVETDDRDDTYESLDFDFESPEDLEAPDSYTLTELPPDDLAEVMESVENEDETDESGPTAISDELLAISTERLEDIITEAVKDVVERVTRETMSEVAEKVIKEAIEGLKQSLEPPPS